jgi:hypothetical protein
VNSIFVTMTQEQRVFYSQVFDAFRLSDDSEDFFGNVTEQNAKNCEARKNWRLAFSTCVCDRGVGELSFSCLWKCGYVRCYKVR